MQVRTENIKISKILLVEDDFNIRFVTSEFLKMSNFQVSCAENGKVALDVLGREDFDLVMTDVMMPVMNGAELVKSIRTLKGDSFPVIVVSGSDIDHIVLMENEFTKTLRKPYPFEALMQNIHSLEENIRN